MDKDSIYMGQYGGFFLKTIITVCEFLCTTTLIAFFYIFVSKMK